MKFKEWSVHKVLLGRETLQKMACRVHLRKSQAFWLLVQDPSMLHQSFSFVFQITKDRVVITRVMITLTD